MKHSSLPSKSASAVKPSSSRKMRIRWMTGEDLNAAFAIEQAANAHAWNALQFAEALYRPNCVGLVAEVGSQMVGYVIHEKVDAASLHVWRIAVLPEFQRHGIASQLIARAICLPLETRCRSVRMEVREGNLGAQLFLRSLGFKATSIQRDFYEDTHEDAYRMEYAYRCRSLNYGEL